MSDTLTPGYALNRLYSYAFEAPCTKRDPGLTDINMARDVLLVAIKQLAARDQQIAALREALRLMYYGSATLSQIEIQEHARSLLLGTLPAEPDDEIRMPMTPGIPGMGVVVSAGPRPELVIERDVSSIDCERCGRYIELDEHEGDLCNDCRAKQPGEAT